MSAGRSVTCPSCGGTIAIKAAGYSVTVACQYCGSVLDVTQPDVKLIEEYHQAALTLPLPIGSRGNLFNVEWEVIGYLERSDGEASWSEYLLFNPYAGYRWLTCADRAWQFGTMLLDQPDGDQASVGWRGRRFTQDYEPATTVTDRVVGEFYWRVRAGDRVQAMTYSDDDDDVLSVEWGADETSWTHLVDVEGKTVGTAFGVVKPAASGYPDPRPGQNLLSEGTPERRSGWADLPRILMIGAVAAFLILVVMGLLGTSTSSTKGAFSVGVDGPEQSKTIGTLTVTRPYQFVTVTASASDFVNRWIDLDYSLVNRATQQSIDATDTVEYYQGRDSDGDWTEGGHTTVTKFAGVPRGTYDLVVDASAHTWSEGSTAPPPNNAWSAEEIAVQFTAEAGGVMWANYSMALMLLFAVPGVIAWLTRKR